MESVKSNDKKFPEKFVQLIDTYTNEPTIDRDDDPLKYWDSNKTSFQPLLI